MKVHCFTARVYVIEQQGNLSTQLHVFLFIWATCAAKSSYRTYLSNQQNVGLSFWELYWKIRLGGGAYKRLHYKGPNRNGAEKYLPKYADIITKHLALTWIES